MLHSFWKVMPVFALSLGALPVDAKMFQSHEEHNMDMEECEEKCCFACRERPCRQIACFCLQDEVDPCRPCWYIPLRECVSCWGESVRVDFLYWGAQNNGFAYGQTFNQTGNPFTYSQGAYAMQRIAEHWSPGVRVSLMHEFKYDFWDVSASWTWYKNTMSASQDLSNSNSQFISLYDEIPYTQTFNKGSGKWKVLYNVIDLDLAKEYRLSKAFAVRPHWGLRAAWIHQNFQSIVENSAALNPTYLYIGLHTNQNWFGFGPRVGACSDWEVGYGFSIVGKVAGSALYGKMKPHSEFNIIHNGTFNYTVEDDTHQFTPSLQTFLGLQWGLGFNDGKAACVIQAGWETNYWWNQFHLPVLTNLNQAPRLMAANQPLELEGLTLNVRFDF